ncbi:MAG: HAMP domain-containing histidine kinase [Hyphomicrobium sp.]|uniref:HAMP domain-containing sensor histidine kinase n=1 Tax=Hyphomicrobium sp. TaxID=82 RepID=UPI0013267B04|nr:HAMP domain-containing sensor histidine kinase [Hyphomicrobium sp.]KAB2937487.1 MAG: HAMP domain-containing histidine kinase [Hyphomicrobium sp.]MBZ0211798.1 HAMP domain-containing histidine kinase [Hyphomicrobium sp.]
MALPDRLARAVSTTAFRVAAVTVAVYLACAGLVVGLLLWQTNRVLTSQVLATLNAEAELLKAEAQEGDRAALIRAVEARGRPGGLGLYYLADKSGTKLAGNLSRLPPEIVGSPAGGVFRYAPDARSQSEHLAVAIPVDLGGGEQLIVGRDVEEQRRFASEMGTVYFLALGFLTLGGLVAGFAVSRVALKRIETINVAARSIMAGDMSRRIAVTGAGDEFDVLATNLNAMLERIEALMSGLREVSDNIAHDLKTPLTRLRNSAEAALRETGENAYREGLEHTIEKADELIKTFNSLLLVARLEAGALEENAERFDIGRAVRDVAELYEPVAEERGMGLIVKVESGPQFMGNRQLVVQAVANLIENAIKYSGKPGVNAGTAISIDLHNLADSVEICVADNGPGIAPQDRERVLKRFVRLEKSRTEPGTGLGLSLVQAVARLHGGAVRLEDNHPGLRVVLTLPKRD